MRTYMAACDALLCDENCEQINSSYSHKYILSGGNTETFLDVTFHRV